MANCLPPSFESNSYRGGNIVIDLSGNNQNYSELISAYDSAKPAIYLGDGWCTFPDLDNFDSEKLLKAFTLKEKDSCESIWDPSLTYKDSCQRTSLSISALRQLEALFNLSQLLFGLSRAETVNYTFRDLQLRKHPHSFKKSGFKQLNFDGRTDFYAIFEQLVNVIIEEGGLEVTLLMYKNPMLPMVRQKCLDLISNVATVPDVAYKIMRHQSWFLDHLLILVRDGEIVSDKIPALSVLIRLLKVMLTERMISAYMKLVDMQYIDCLVDIFENSQYTDSAEFLPFFIKFEFITMQSLTVILGDSEYSQLWSDKAKTRLLNYCMVVFLKAAGAYPTNPNSDRMEQINHIFYAEQHTNKHSLAHTIMTVTELLRNDESMKMFYRYHRPFKQLIIQLYKKYGAKSQYIRTDPGISYALNHLMRVLYIKNSHPSGNAFASSTVSSIQQQSVKSPRHSTKNLLNDLDADRKEPKVCSNPDCKNEETKYKKFKICVNCNGQAAYCSSKCKKAHLGTHMINDCRRDELIYNCRGKQDLEHTDDMNYENVKATKRQSSYNRIYSSTSTSNYQKNATSRRASENLHQKNYQDHFQKLSDVQQRRRESSGGRECNYQGMSKQKKLSKFSSMNDNQRRNSLTNEQCTDNFKTSKVQVRTVYAKHTSSMKESKSAALRRMSALDEEANNKLKLLNSRDNHQTKSILINDTTTTSFQFHRPLKTSTALCLPDLTRRQSLKEERIVENLQEDQTMYKQENGSMEHQLVNHLKITNNTLEPNQKISDSSSSYASNISSSESTSISSTVSNNPQKKIKTSSGNKAIPKIEKLKKQKESKKQKEQQFEELNQLSKRRLSGTSSMSSPSTSTTSQTTATTTIASTASSHTTSNSDKAKFNSIEEVLFYKGSSGNSNANSDPVQYMDNMDNSSSNDENDDTDIDSDQEEDVFSDNSSSENSTQSSIDQMDETEKRTVKVQKYTNLENEANDDNEEDSENWPNADNENVQLIRNRLSGYYDDGQGPVGAGTSQNQSKKSQGNDDDEDECERRSHFKVVKEFEKTMEFVKNASNLKVMPSLMNDPQNQPQQDPQPQAQVQQDNYEKQPNDYGNQQEQQQISLASLYYDYDEMDSQKIANQLGSNKNQLKLLSSDDEENDSDSDSSCSKEPAFSRENRPSLKGRNLMKGVNLIINNSIDSHMLTSNYNLKSAPANSTAQNSTPLNRKNTDVYLKKNYQKNYRCNANGVSTPYLGSKQQLISDRKMIDDSDGYRGSETANCITQGDEFIDDEMSLFKKNNDTLKTNRLSDYKSFKGPLEPTKENANIFHGVASTPNLQYTQNQTNRRSVLINNELILHKEKDMRNRHSQLIAQQQQQQQQQVFVQKHTQELKVFNNLQTNTNMTINSLNQTEQSTNGAVKSELPKNSTPISTDLGTQQHLSAKHRHFLNAQLDLTIVPGKQQTAHAQRKTNSPNNQNPVFLVPQIPMLHNEQKQMVSSTPTPPEIKKSSLSTVNMGSYKTSTLKSNSNLVVNSNDIHKKKLGNHLLTSDILDVSKISALENATSTNACVVVTKADIPKDLRRSLKDEFKKDKKQCSIS